MVLGLPPPSPPPPPLPLPLPPAPTAATATLGSATAPARPAAAAAAAAAHTGTPHGAAGTALAPLELRGLAPALTPLGPMWARTGAALGALGSRSRFAAEERAGAAAGGGWRAAAFGAAALARSSASNASITAHVTGGGTGWAGDGLGGWTRLGAQAAPGGDERAGRGGVEVRARVRVRA